VVRQIKKAGHPLAPRRKSNRLFAVTIPLKTHAMLYAKGSRLHRRHKDEGAVYRNATNPVKDCQADSQGNVKVRFTSQNWITAHVHPRIPPSPFL